MRIIPRSETGLAKAKRTIAAIGPKSLVFRHHSVTIPENHGSVAEHWRYIQQIAFSRGFWDISYSFGIFPDGSICEGRGWGKLGAHTSGYNDDSYGIVFVGNYDQRRLTPEQILSYRWLIWEGKRLGWLTGTPTQREHDEVSATACPGNNVESERAALDQPYDGQVPPAPPTPPPTPPPSTDWTEEMIMALPTLKRGSTGQHVRNLQGLLVANGRPTGVDGIFGPGTESKLKDWQAAAGVQGGADGICGKYTWRGLIGA